MHNVVKKTVFTALAVFSLVVAPLVTPIATASPAGGGGDLGGASFNTDPNDRPTLRVTNYTRNADCSTCWSYETAADPGDTVSFDMYYHNTGDATARNTTVSVSLSPSGSYLSANGTVAASNASPASGNANVNVDMTGYTNLRATFLSASWYPDRSASGQSIAANGGSASIGDIEPGWDSQGHVVFRFKIEADRTSAGGPEICGNNKDDDGDGQIDEGCGSTGGGNTNAYGYHDGYAGAQPVSQCKAFGWAADPDSPNSPLQVKIYVDGQFRYLTTANLYRQDVQAANMPGCSSGSCGFSQQLDGLSAGPHNITTYAVDKQTGEMLRLNTTDKAIECGSGGGTVEPPKTCSVTATTLAAYGTSANSTNLKGRVNYGTASNGKYWFELSTDSTFQNNVQRVTTPNPQSGDVSHYLTGLLSNTTYYFRVVAQADCGTQYGEILSFKTDYVPPITVTPTCQTRPSVSLGSATGVTDSSANISGSVSPNGSATNWRLELRRAGVLVDQRTGSAGTNGSAAVNANWTGLAADAAYTVTLIADSCAGSDTTNVFFTTGTGTCTPAAPTVTTGSATRLTDTTYRLTGSFTGSPTSVRMEYRRIGDSAWITAGFGSTVDLGGLAPNTSYEFRMVAQNSCGTATGTAVQFTTTGGGQCTVSATTGSATNVTDTSATISGSVSGSPSTVLMQYRRQGDTAWITAANGNSASLSGLAPGTTYEFRITAQGADASCSSTGSVQTFTTTGGGQCSLSATTGSATNITDTSASISGSYSGNPTAILLQYRRQGDTTWITGGSGTTAYLSGLSSNTTYEYRMFVQNSNCTAVGSIQTFTTTGGGGQCTTLSDAITNSPSSVSSYSVLLNGEVNPRGSQTDAWFQWSANRSDLDYDSGGYTVGFASMGSGSSYRTHSATLTNLQPGTRYFYRVVSRSSCGTDRGTILEFVTQGTQIFSQPPTVITNPATNVGRTVALLNGRVNPNGGTTSAWFEWGTTLTNVANGGGTRTPSQPMGSGTLAIDTAWPLSGLTAGRTYYFRAAASNPSGTNYGQVLSFTTTSGGGGGTIIVRQPQPPVVVTTLGGAFGSCLTLTPSLNGEILPGGEVVYGITYRNDCPFDLQNTTLRNILPNEVDFSSTNYPFLTRDLNVITYSLGTVPRNFQATILVRGILRPTARIGDTLIFKSDLSFVDPQGRFQTVSATLPAAVGGGATATGQVLGASIFGTLAGLFTSGWFWFLLFLLLLALFILWLATRNRGEDHDHE